MVDANYEGEMSVIVIDDGEGNEMYYEEEVVIPYNDKEFAILVSLPPEDCGADCACHEEPEIIIARIDATEDGEEEYVAPTDEEFDAVLAIYEELGEDK